MKRNAPTSGDTVNPARLAAARALMAVADGAHAEEALAALLPEEARDRGLAWRLVFGVLRHRASIDASLQRCLRQPLASLDQQVQAILRVGAFEKLHGDAKAYAVVNEAVGATRAMGVGRASGLVNAVLRRVRIPDDLARHERLEHPSWLVERWDDRYGEEATTRWCENNGKVPPISLVAKDAPALAARLAEEGIETEPVVMPEGELQGLLRLKGGAGRVEQLPGFDEGAFWVQDVASVYTADLVPDDAQTVLDACAAPGGKTFRLLGRGKTVTAVDLKKRRLARMEGSLERLGFEATLRRHDWRKGPLPELGEVDAVLVDAPCTGLGTIRRRPEIRWRRSPLDPLKIHELQVQVITNASKHVRPGGSLVYIVCSPEPEEGPGVIEDFLKDHPDFRVDVWRNTAPPSQDEDAFQAVRLLRA